MITIEEQQREIGRQQVLARIVLSENRKVQNNELSFVQDDDLIEWMNCSIHDLSKMGNTCARLNDFILSVGAAKKFTETYHNTENEYHFWASVFLWSGGIYISTTLTNNIDLSMLKSANHRYYKEFGIGDDSIKTLEAAFKFFLKYILNEISEVNKLYDWSIIQIILNENKKFSITQNDYLYLCELMGEDFLRKELKYCSSCPQEQFSQCQNLQKEKNGNIL